MATLELVALNGTRLTHRWWGELDTHKCPNEGYCQSCDGGLDSCSVCGCDNQGGATTHCPGERVDMLITSALVYKAGLDYKNGEWIWTPERRRYVAERNEIIVLDHQGSIDRLVAYAEARMAKVHSDYEPRYLEKRMRENLTIAIRPAIRAAV